jgi:hypothetical protein
MTDRACVRCGAPYPEHPECGVCGRRHPEFESCPAEDELVAIPEEAWQWVSAWDRKGGHVCPDCATVTEKRREADQCVRCGTDEPDGWDELRDGEWLRVSPDGGVCPECWVPADVEAESQALAELGPTVGKFGLSWSDDAIERNAQALQALERLRNARGPDDF